MILYNIQHFGEPKWLPWLLRAIDNENNSFVINYDGPQDLFDRLRGEISSQIFAAKRVDVIKSIPIHWCGPSQARNFLSIIDYALEIDGWEYFINLSGTCAPIAPQARIFNALRYFYSSGKICHVFSFKVNERPVLPVLSDTHEKSLLEMDRLRLRGANELLEQFQDLDYFPVTNVQNRPFISCFEPFPEERILSVGRPALNELRFRVSYFSQYQHFAGRAWYIFHRSGLERLQKFLSSPPSLDWRDIFLQCFEPDESFIQTAIFGHGIFSEDEVRTRNFHAYQGTPKNFTDENIAEAFSDHEAFFVRKVWHNNALKIREKIDQIVRS